MNTIGKKKKQGINHYELFIHDRIDRRWHQKAFKPELDHRLQYPLEFNVREENTLFQYNLLANVQYTRWSIMKKSKMQPATFTDFYNELEKDQLKNIVVIDLTNPLSPFKI